LKGFFILPYGGGPGRNDFYNNCAIAFTMKPGMQKLGKIPKIIMTLISAIAILLAYGLPLKAKTAEDQLGRKLRVPDDPQRIIALAPSITEIIFALEQQDRLKGTTQFSNYPDGNPKETVDRLQSLNIPVFAANPHNLESMMQTIQKIGDILNASAKAKTLVADMRRRVQQVDVLVSRIERRPRVFIQIGISPIISAGRNTFIHELIVRAGGGSRY
jgi:iron complex transport system substrate-binding protein